MKDFETRDCHTQYSISNQNVPVKKNEIFELFHKYKKHWSIFK